MITFLIGLALLIVGAAIYGRVCEKVIKPTDDKTPAVKQFDGVDYVPMKKWKNSLIELLNIAGTGPILGPIQGILFGPIAFITIPIGCVLGGAMHDFMCGMISVRSDGEQMPNLVKRFLGKYAYRVYNVLVCLLMLLVGVVFIYTPGDIFVTQILNQDSTLSNPIVWVVYGAIFIYYIIATLLPIDKIIGKIYPIFGAVLLLSAIGVFAGLFLKDYKLDDLLSADDPKMWVVIGIITAIFIAAALIPLDKVINKLYPLFGSVVLFAGIGIFIALLLRGYKLDELWSSGFSFVNPYGEHFIPIFFVTVACGIVSGFHSTQATLISRTMGNEHEGRMTFYNMMILEGFIAMVWAAAAMGAVQSGLATNDMLHDSPTAVVGIVAKDMLGSVGGIIAIIGVIVLPITSGDTSLRSLRIMLSDAFHLDTTKKRNNLLLALVIFGIVGGILIYAKSDSSGFNVLWRYFSWANECTAVFAFAMISVYMIRHEMPFLMALIPGTFYMYIVSAYILNAKIGFGLPWTASYIIAAVLALGYVAALVLYGHKKKREESLEIPATEEA